LRRRDGIARARLREQEHLEADLVAIRVVDEVPRTLPVLRGGIRNDRDLALAPLPVADAFPERGAGQIPRLPDVAARDGRADEAREHLPDRASLLGVEGDLLRLAVEAVVVQIGPARILRRPRWRSV